jgi:hypothetical protein
MTVLRIISESELQLIQGWRYDAPEEHAEDFKQLLWNLGCNVHSGIELQSNTHRNNLGNVVSCRRWVCFERSDKEWLESGYASRDALNEYSGSSLLVDLVGARRRKEVLNDNEEDAEKYSEGYSEDEQQDDF